MGDVKLSGGAEFNMLNGGINPYAQAQYRAGKNIFLTARGTLNEYGGSKIGDSGVNVAAQYDIPTSKENPRENHAWVGAHLSAGTGRIGENTTLLHTPRLDGTESTDVIASESVNGMFATVGLNAGIEQKVAKNTNVLLQGQVGQRIYNSGGFENGKSAEVDAAIKHQFNDRIVGFAGAGMRIAEGQEPEQKLYLGARIDLGRSSKPKPKAEQARTEGEHSFEQKNTPVDVHIAQTNPNRKDDQPKLGLNDRELITNSEYHRLHISNFKTVTTGAIEDKGATGTILLTSISITDKKGHRFELVKRDDMKSGTAPTEAEQQKTTEWYREALKMEVENAWKREKSVQDGVNSFISKFSNHGFQLLGEGKTFDDFKRQVEQEVAQQTEKNRQNPNVVVLQTGETRFIVVDYNGKVLGRSPDKSAFNPADPLIRTIEQGTAEQRESDQLLVNALVKEHPDILAKAVGARILGTNGGPSVVMQNGREVKLYPGTVLNTTPEPDLSRTGTDPGLQPAPVEIPPEQHQTRERLRQETQQKGKR